MKLPNDLKDFDEDSFRIIDADLAGSIICWGVLILIVLRDVARMI